MRVDLWFLALLAAAPATYAWWSGRTIRRALNDPALPELLLARQRRIAKVTIVAIVVSALLTAPAGFSIVALFGVLAAQYPVRRAVYGDTWSFAQYLRFTSFSWIAFGGLWLFPLVMTGVVVRVAQAWVPEPSAQRTMLGLALGIVAAMVYVAWQRNFVRVWLALHQATPLDASGAHAALLPRFQAALDRAGTRVPVHPTVHRYGAPGGRIVNAVALCSLRMRSVAMSDTLLDNLDADEATAVFAHELAHHEHHTDVRLRRRGRASYVLALCLAAIPALQLASGGRYAFALDGLFLFAILVFIGRGQQRHRAHETECDLRAVDLTGDPDAVIRGLTKIHALSRMPRRFSQEFERAATHPSLARRIQAIRAHASTAAPEVSAEHGPTVVATTTPGAYVVLDDTRSSWFEGAAPDAPLDVAVLREQATSYRVLAYGELCELRLIAERPRMLHARDLAGRAWSVGIRDEDVARVQATLDRVDAKLGTPAESPRVSSAPTARLVAAALVLATMLGGFFGIPMLVGVVALFAPTASSLAAVAAVTLGQVGIALASGERGMLGELGAPYGTFALAAAVPLALWAAWMAWRWRRTPPSGESPHAKRWSRALYAVLALGVLFSGSDLVFGGVSSPSALLGDGDVARSAVALCGLGAALLVLRGRAWRLAGTGALAIGATGVVAGLMGERWVSDASAISWTTGRLSLVASVPIGREVNEVALSPNGTRYLTRRWIGDDEDESGTYARQIVTGRISAAGATRTFTALDAVLPTEGEVLVLARVAGDSLELRLERADADSASRVVWRRTLPALVDAHLQLDAHRARWVVRGRLADRAHPRLATVSGAIDGADVRQAEVPADSLRGQVVYSYGDGASLVIGMTPRRADDFTRGSVVATYLSVLRGNALTWTLWRFEQGGSRAVKQLHGYPTCASSMEDDVAICVEQGRGATHVWRVARDSLADLGSLARRYDRATASQGGTVVASSYQGNAIAIVDAMHKRGVRTTLPKGEYAYVREVSATDSTVLALLGSAQGLRLAVYRLSPTTTTGRIAQR